MNPFRYPTTLLSLLLFAGSATLRGHEVTVEMTEAASHFLAALTPEQRSKATFEFKNDERLNWDFVPRDRAGLTFKDMTSEQRALAHALLSSGLSHRGYAKALTIMSLDQILRDLENQRGPRRDPELYYVSIFGQPSATNAWGWRVEGHHLSVNFSVAGNTGIVGTPSFLGSNPALVIQGPRQGLRVLGREEDLGRELVRSLTDAQKKVAIYTNVAPSEIITGKSRKVSPLSPDGLAAATMTSEQQQRLKRLVAEYVGRLRAELAEADLKRIEAAGWNKVHFAWAGSIEPGEGHYYRVQGPTFLLEFDDTQNNANHIHAAWRDFENDFGGDLLRRHYEQTPHDR